MVESVTLIVKTVVESVTLNGLLTFLQGGRLSVPYHRLSVTHGPCWGLHIERERETLRRFSPWSLCRSHPLSLMFLQGGRLSVPYHRDASDVSVTIELSPRTNYTGGPLQRHPSPFSRCFNSDGEGVSAQTTPAVRYKTTQTVNGHCRQGKPRQAKPSQGKARQ